MLSGADDPTSTAGRVPSEGGRVHPRRAPVPEGGDEAAVAHLAISAQRSRKRGAPCTVADPSRILHVGSRCGLSEASASRRTLITQPAHGNRRPHLPTSDLPSNPAAPLSGRFVSAAEWR